MHVLLSQKEIVSFYDWNNSTHQVFFRINWNNHSLLQRLQYLLNIWPFQLIRMRAVMRSSIRRIITPPPFFPSHRPPGNPRVFDCLKRLGCREFDTKVLLKVQNLNLALVGWGFWNLPGWDVFRYGDVSSPYLQQPRIFRCKHLTLRFKFLTCHIGPQPLHPTKASFKFPNPPCQGSNSWGKVGKGK